MRRALRSDSDEHDLNREGEHISLTFLEIRKDLLGKTKVKKDISKIQTPLTEVEIMAKRV